LTHSGSQTLEAAPPTPAKPVTDTYFGTHVVDDYQWLENRDDPAVSRWVEAQNNRSRAYLDALPERAGLLARIRKDFAAIGDTFYDPIWVAGGVWFLRELGASTESVVTRTALRSREERLLFSSAGLGIATPSPNGKLMVVSMDKGGSEMYTLKIIDIATRRELPDRFLPDWMPGGGEVSWLPDSSGFYYANHPKASALADVATQLNQQVYLHRVGTSSLSDKPLPGQNFPKIAEIVLSDSPDHRYHMVRVNDGPGGKPDFYSIGPSGRLW
jgi:prolyl oligopeptidase